MSSIVKFNPTVLSTISKKESSPFQKIIKKDVDLISKVINNKAIHMLFGIDATSSTSNIIDDFRNNINNITKKINENISEVIYHFGYFNGREQVISSNKENITTCLNYPSLNNPDAFLKKIIDSELYLIQDIPNIIVLFADGWEPYGHEMNKICAKLLNSNSYVFFILDGDAGLNNSNDIKNCLIDALGEKGILIEGLENTSTIVNLIIKMSEYVTNSNNQIKGKQITFKNFLEKSGGISSGLQITQGSTKLLD